MRLLVLFLATGALFAQPDARSLVRQSVENGERAWRRSFDYHCTKTDVERTFESDGRVKSVTTDVYDVYPLGYGTSFELHVMHNGVRLSEQQMASQRKRLDARRAESVEAKRRRFEKELSERSYMQEVPDAFDFKITGTANLPTGPAWVVQATPRPGYQPRSRYGRMFSSMRGKLWIDQHYVQWVKADAEAMNSVSFGFFVARLAKGSHIVLEQMKLSGGEWVPRQIQARAQARVLLFFNHNFEEVITYSDYRLENDLSTQ